MKPTVNPWKRLLLGRVLRSGDARTSRLPKRLALAVFASDPLSSVAYATQEMLLVLSVGGSAYLFFTPWLALGVIVLMTVVVVSYRQVVQAYPEGGGSYQVVTSNFGPRAGLVVGAALMVDYVLTVAVSVASGVDNVISAFPALGFLRVELAVVVVALLTFVNLRGVRESGKLFSTPTYLFVFAILLMCLTGLLRWSMGNPPVAESAHYRIIPGEAGQDLAGLALVMLVLRAFSSGCTALTGVEAISNGVPAFREPRSRNAAATMTIMAMLAISMFAGVTALAMISRVHIAADPCDLAGLPSCHGVTQETVIAQLGAAVFGHRSVGFFCLQAITAVVLVLAANTAFNGFPPLASLLARNRYLPRQFYTRGDRLVFSNGIMLLATAAVLLLIAFEASVTSLVHLYVLGVFTSFTLSQAGMVRHWNKRARHEKAAAVRRRHHTARLLNAVGATVTGVVLLIVLLTKFAQGAWLTVLTICLLWVTMMAVRRHYDAAARELTIDEKEIRPPAPRLTHAVIPVARLNRAVLLSVGYAASLRASHVEAVTVAVDHREAQSLNQHWRAAGLEVPLKTLASPYREITKPLLGYIRTLQSPDRLVAVLFTEYMTGRWWERLLHNQSTRWLRLRLMLLPGVIIVSVPWQLSSAARLTTGRRPHAPGEVRRGTQEAAPYRPDASSRTA